MPFRPFVKSVLDATLGPLGFEIRRHKEIDFTANYLARIAEPKTVIDVGVGEGTQPLYDAYPDARLILVEPLQEHLPYAYKAIESRNGEVIECAVGDSEGELSFKVQGEKSTLVTSDRVSMAPPEAVRTVQVTTLDRIAADRPDLPTPILLKIDTEGYELSVLRGATELLKKVDLVIAEVTVAPRFDEGYRFEDVVSFMKDHGFTTFSILTSGNSPGHLRQGFADIVFKRLPDNECL